MSLKTDFLSHLPGNSVLRERNVFLIPESTTWTGTDTWQAPCLLSEWTTKWNKNTFPKPWSVEKALLCSVSGYFEITQTRAGERAQWLRACVALEDDVSSVSSSHVPGSQPSGTPISEDPVASSGFLGHHARARTHTHSALNAVHIHTCKQLIHVNSKCKIKIHRLWGSDWPLPSSVMGKQIL